MPIVQATMTASSAGHMGPRTFSSAMIEKAMSDAVLDCMKEGITDPDIIRARKLAAREHIKNLPVYKTIGNRVIITEAVSRYVEPEPIVEKKRPWYLFWKKGK